ncbi:MAG TPA: GIY-YIG nuclease family protein [Candidatus Paceibacterota bacterium]|nr:GIY-YIG nuclease family protein [Candidatus Paceibacterota bacterium]
MFYIYLLQSRIDEHLYIGYTTDLKKRVDEHNRGLNLSTKRYGKWNLIYYEACLNERDAKRREKYLKTTQGRRMLKRRLKDYFYEGRGKI